MPGSIDMACERAISRQRETYRELATDIPLVLLHGEIHVCRGVHGRVMDGTAVCPGHIWINGRLLTGLRRTAGRTGRTRRTGSTRCARNEEPHKSSANDKQESKE